MKVIPGFVGRVLVRARGNISYPQASRSEVVKILLEIILVLSKYLLIEICNAEQLSFE